MELYFVNAPELFDEYLQVTQILKTVQAGDVGLRMGNDDWEYPLWVFAQAHADAGASMSFRHIGVTNPSGELQTDTSLPSYVISTRGTEPWEFEDQYDPVLSLSRVAVLERK